MEIQNISRIFALIKIKTIHSSLAIEHNSLSLKQMTDIIDGKRVLGAPDEIQEVKNAIEAYRLMPELDAFKEKDLLRAHDLMMKDLVRNAGHYRQEGGVCLMAMAIVCIWLLLLSACHC